MSFVGVFDLFRGRPRHPVGADGRMALSDHMRELRARLLKSTVVLTALFVVGLFFWSDLLLLVMDPYNSARIALEQDVETVPTVRGATGPLLLPLKLAGAAALVASAPFWLYQVWAFIMPGLHPTERKWTRIFTVVAGPLFLGGVLLCYYVLPKGLEVLIGFTPGGFTNLVDFGEYFSFLTRMLLVFGLGMEIPLFVVMLNLAGVVSGKAIGRARPWIILGTVVFAAVATPSTDPFAMIALAIPMLILFAVSEVIARLVDRARGRKEAEGLGDDELSPL